MQHIPRLGLGTFRLQGQAVIDSVANALEAGYRAIDTAQIYANEADIGQALAASAVPRSELFITTKVWIDALGRDRLIPSLRESLARLRTDHVDLVLIHWPSPNGAVPLAETLEALAQATELGLTRCFGVSNFTIDLLREAVSIAGPGRIATNQVEISPYLQNRRLAAFAHEQGVHLTSYMTLGYGKVNDDAVLGEIGARHGGASPAQVALAWALQRGFAVIPSSTRRAHLESNLKAVDLRLTAADMAAIEALDRNERLASPAGLAPAWD